MPAAPPPPPDVRAAALKATGNAAYAADDLATALDSYNKALALAPDSPILHTNKAAALVRLSRAAEESGDAVGAQARALAAEEEATLALALDPSHVKALRRRAAARVALRDFRLALDDLHAALEATPAADGVARAALAAEIEAVKAGANHFTYRDSLTGAVLAEITELETDRLALGAREEASVHTRKSAARAKALEAAAAAAAKGLRAQALTVYSAWAEEAAAQAAAAEAEAAAGTVRPSGRRGRRGGTLSRPPASSREPGGDGENNRVGGDGGEGGDPTSTAALHALVSFAAALTTADADGRVVVERGLGTSGAPPPSCSSSSGPPDPALRFVLLNAGARFGAVLAEARAVVLASGTLEPSASLAAQLFPPPPLLPSSAKARTAAAAAAAAATGKTTAPLSPAPPPPPFPLPPSVSHPLATAARFSCGHVLPRERLLALSLGTGPTGRPLDLRASARGSEASLDEVGALLANVCSVVPGGVVAFFPSFAYLRQASERWRATGALRRMEAKKKVFVEPRGAAEVAPTLAAFGRAARGKEGDEVEEEEEEDDGSDDGERGEDGDRKKKRAPPFLAPVARAVRPAAAASFPPPPPPPRPPRPPPTSPSSGALLLSVIGAKLSEGINFGDALGRAVVVLGIPYPAPDDAELVERMAFLEERSRGAGRALYEDSAAVAVNQCVGRVVRHAGDWAAVILADARYTKRSGSGMGGSGGGGAPPPPPPSSTMPSSSSSAPASVPPVERLPGWMKPSLRVAASYGEAHSALARFCREMAKKDREEGEKVEAKEK